LTSELPLRVRQVLVLAQVLGPVRVLELGLALEPGRHSQQLPDYSPMSP